MIKGLLKKLCISLLIGLPILFVNISNANYASYLVDTLVGEEYKKTVLVNGNVGTIYNDVAKSVFAPSNGVMFFWDTNGDPVLKVPDFYDCQTKINYTSYYICDEITSNNITSMTNCNKQAIDHSFLDEFLGTIKQSDYWAYEYNTAQNSYYSFNLCFSSASKGQSVCFKFEANQGANMWCYRGSDMTGGYISYNFNTIPGDIIGSSPALSSSAPTFTIDNPTYTNQDIIDGYEYLGLEVGYCYGGFDIDNIFLPNETIDDFTGYKFGYGATVFDLYNLYSGAYSTPKTFFAQMSQAYSNGQINRFKNEPKALIMFVQQFMSAKSRGRVNVGFYDLRDYCNLKFNANPDDEYTGHNETGKRGADQKKTDNQNKGGFNFTGNNALNRVVGSGGTGFSNPAQFFGNITQLFQNGVGVVETNYSGMIPTYILMFMFALILIRIIKH